MQSLTDGPRSGFTAAQVQYLIENTSSIDAGMGLQLLDGLSTMAVQADLSDWLTTATISRSNFAEIHSAATFTIDLPLSWGDAIVRPYMTLTGPTSSTATTLTTMQFYQGAYFVDSPEEDLSDVPSTWDVTGYDILSVLDDSVGDDYSIDKGVLYLALVEQIFLDLGITFYHIDQARADAVAASPKVWLLDEDPTWLQVVNHCLGAVGYQGVWTDWNGAFQVREYQRPVDRPPEWRLEANIANTLLTQRRRRSRDYYNAYNRWIFYQSNVTEEQPVDGNGRYEYTNQYQGDTSVEARGGRTITKPPEGVEVADHAALVAYAQRVIDADMMLPTKITQETAPLPLIWHMDRYAVSDPALGAAAEVLSASWTMNLDGSDVQHEWTEVGSPPVYTPPPEPGVPAGLPKASTLLEDWRTLDTVKWPDRSNATVSGWRLRLTVPSLGTTASISTGTIRYDLTNSSIFIETTKRLSDATGSQSMHAVASLSPENRISIGVEAGNLLMRKVENGSVSDTTIAYDVWAHRYRRLRHDGTNVHWETSTNGVNWVDRRTPTTTTIDLSSVFIYIEALWFTSPAGASPRAEFGPINILATTPVATSFPPASFGSLVTLSGSAASRWSIGMRQAMQEYSWSAYETGDNAWSTSERDWKISERGSLTSPGFRVTAGLGVQSSPSYLSTVSNPRLVNEAGTSSTGTIYDMVWNQLIRDKVERYFARIQSEQGFISNYNIIRLTSGMDAEALYPGGGWWAYSAGAQSGTNLPATQRVCPYPGWHPGQTTITTTQVREWLEWYIDSLVDTLNWQIRYFRSLGFTGWFEVVAPGLGTRLNSIAAEITGFLGSASSTTKVGAIWPWIFQRLVDRHGVVCYCSSVADKSGTPVNNLPDLTADPAVDLTSSTVLNWSAARHFVRIGTEFQLPNSGENPGWGGFGEFNTAYYNSTGTSDVTTQMAYACRRYAITGEYMNFYWAHDNVLNGDIAGATFTAANYQTVVITPTNAGVNPLTPTPSL